MEGPKLDVLLVDPWQEERRSMLLTLVYGEDWEGLYVRDELRLEGESIDPFEAILLAIEVGATGVVRRQVDDLWLEDRRTGRTLPRDLCDVRWDEDRPRAVPVDEVLE